MNAASSTPDPARQILDLMPTPVLVVDRDLRVLDHNRAAHELLAVPVESARGLRSGHILHCLNAIAHQEGCGQTPFCARCGLRNALNAASRVERTVHTRTAMRLVHAGTEEEHIFRLTVAPFEQEGEARWLLILEDQTELKELEDLFPFCSSCGQARTDEALRKKAAAYLRKHRPHDTATLLCADCHLRLYGPTGNG